MTRKHSSSLTSFTLLSNCFCLQFKPASHNMRLLYKVIKTSKRNETKYSHKQLERHVLRQTRGSMRGLLYHAVDNVVQISPSSIWPHPTSLESTSRWTYLGVILSPLSRQLPLLTSQVLKQAQVSKQRYSHLIALLDRGTATEIHKDDPNDDKNDNGGISALLMCSMSEGDTDPKDASFAVDACCDSGNASSSKDGRVDDL
ncbi:hypothetical protein BCR41DRAFT_386657 [Lobosporangium transversale]|uniref:Uncharacterized protein n=1 Tax=Lobosporangium transversale TaxID=64571 RepID=A0A1Y2GRT8_9FUNG|nr:hypothetical protein BCR41DRAFT_386657 [Lobosporangium transversale]ORZ15552.1 hypothetical protein BCR41DRAFT_386657 [Lobosporangium transversale]|eukprot:XP_021881300.1 hypothetical protein BCR41DRAFT_386657 [Lobosporangium transversale]